MKILAKAKQVVLVTALCCLPLQGAYANDFDRVIAAINAMSNAVVKAINTFHDYAKKRTDENFDQEHPFFDAVAAQNLATDTATDGVGEAAAQAENDFLRMILVPDPNKPPTDLASIISADTYVSSRVFDQRTRERLISARLCGVNNLNYASLVSPLSYDIKLLPCDFGQKQREKRDQALYADNYIKFAAQLNNRLPGSTIEQLAKEFNLDENGINSLTSSYEYRDFAASKRVALASQSAATANLYYLYTQRKAQHDNKGNKIAPSPLEQQVDIATRRTSDNSWYAQMKTALPTVLAREAVMILAEIQTNVMMLRLENQKLMGAQAVTLLRSLQMDKMQLRMKSQNVESAAKRFRKRED